MEKKTLQIKFDDLSTSDGTITGYASVFDVKDSYGDTIVAGAFKDSISDHIQKKTMPSFLWQHNRSEPIGRWNVLEEDEKGLRVEGKLTLGVARAQEAYALMKDNALDGLSIGFRSKKSLIDEETWDREIQEVDLVEISLVTFPANADARIESVKSGEIIHKDKLEKMLMRGAGLSRATARDLMRDGYDGLIAKRGAGAGDVDITELRKKLRTSFKT